MSEQVVSSLGVQDIERAKQFFRDGLGFQIDRVSGFFAPFKDEYGSPAFAVYSGNAVAHDVGLVAGGDGRHGVTMSHVVEDAERVDDLMAPAEAAGAHNLEPAHTAAWGGYIGYFSDPDGSIWKVVVGQSN
jgi:uncharacterized protein